MFTDLEWYWQLIIAAILIVVVPLKVRFLKRQNEHLKAQNRCKKQEDDE